MNKEDTVNVIEMIAKAIYEHDLPDGDEWKRIKEGRKYFYREAAERILDLCYPNGNRVIGILDQAQELPWNPTNPIICANLFGEGYRKGFDAAQKDMITPTGGKVWGKTVC